MIKGIDHIELIVRDLDEYVAFFKTLGFEMVRETPHHGGSVEMKPPGDGQPVFEIHQVVGEEVIGVNHIAFRVDDAGNPAHDQDCPSVSSNAPQQASTNSPAFSPVATRLARYRRNHGERNPAPARRRA